MKKKISILVVAPCAFPLDRGTPIRIERLASLMSEQYDVHVATFHQGRAGDYPFSIHRIPCLPFDLTKSSGASIGKVISDIFLFFLVLRLIPRHNIKLVDGHLHEGALIALAARLIFRKPALYNAHGTLAEEMAAGGLFPIKSWFYHIFQWIEDAIERSVDLVIAQSIMRKENYTKKGISVEDVVVVEDVPLENYLIEEPDLELLLTYKNRNNTVIIYTGELMPYQGVDLTLDAFPKVLDRYPNTILILFGRPIGPYIDRVKQMSRNVFLVDNEPFERLPHYLAISDIALVPRTYGHNVPGKLPIYMMAGKAIIGSDMEGINTVIEHKKTGWLIPPTSASMTEALLQLIENEKLRAMLQSNALAEAQKRYDSLNLKTAMCNAYARVLEQ